MDVVLFIVFVALIAINLFIYHKIFDVVYFDFGKGILKEFVRAFIIAGMELGLLRTAGKWLLNTIFKLLGGVLTFAAVIVGLAAVIYILYCFAKVIKEKQNKSSPNNSSNNSQKTNPINNQPKNTSSTNNNTTQITPEIPSTVAKKSTQKSAPNKQKEKSNTIFCSYCGKQIIRTAKFCNFCGETNQYGRKSINEM